METGAGYTHTHNGGAFFDLGSLFLDTLKSTVCSYPKGDSDQESHENDAVNEEDGEEIEEISLQAANTVRNTRELASEGIRPIMSGADEQVDKEEEGSDGERFEDYEDEPPDVASGRGNNENRAGMFAQIELPRPHLSPTQYLGVFYLCSSA